MSTNKTSNLNLHSWVATDPFKMREFNENFSALDTAVGAKAEAAALSALQSTVSALGAATPHVACGSYRGTGTYGASNPTSLSFSFAPAVVIIVASSGSTALPLVLVRGIQTTNLFIPAASRSQTVTWADNGKTVRWYCNNSDAGSQQNSEYVDYYWVAIG